MLIARCWFTSPAMCCVSYLCFHSGSWWCVPTSSLCVMCLFFVLFFFVYSKRCMKSSWRTAMCMWNTPLVSPYSLSLRVRRVEQPQLSALRETAVLYSEAPLWLFLRLVPRTQAIWNIPKPYLSFFADCFYLDCCGLRIISDCLKRAWHH